MIDDDATTADTVAELTELVAELGRQTTQAFTTGRLPEGFVHDRVTDDFEARMYADFFDDGVWTADGAGWVEGNAQAAAYYAGNGGATWEPQVLSVLVRDPVTTVVTYVVRFTGARDGRTAQAVFVETWQRAPDGWRLRRHLSEKV
jgi:hypothetical protein